MEPPHVGRWFNVDFLGLICMTIAVGTILGEFYLVNGYTLYPMLSQNPALAGLLMVIFNSLLGMVCWVYFVAMTSEPGVVETPPPDAVIEDRSQSTFELSGERVTVCRRCRGFRPERAHHCSTCGRCVRLMDHHCIWINNCVGERTQKFFMQFLMYVALAGTVALGIQGTRLYYCLFGGTAYCGVPRDSVFEYMFLMILSVVLAFTFVLFVLIMLLDQLSSLREDTSFVSRLKKEELKSEKRPFWQRICYIFGEDVEGFSIEWLLPTQPRFSHTSYYGSTTARLGP